MATQSNQIVHADEKRHKCHYCGAVRYESFMLKLDRLQGSACSQFGNDKKLWACRGKCYNPQNVSYFDKKKFGR